MTALVFSKDRALQLDAFLRSVERFVTPRPPLTVIWYPTSDRHARAYLDVFARHPWVISQREGLFKQDVLDALPEGGTVVCFVDDLLFIRPWAVVEWPGLSLRLGLHLTHCYPTQQAQRVPRAATSHALDGTFVWRWADGDGDWGYPLSLDGHLFDVEELRPMIEAVAFISPNTLESALQRFAPRYHEFGTCYHAARIVNLPWNRVQADWDNRVSGTEDTTADALLVRWEAGQQIALDAYAWLEPASCHWACPLVLEARPDRVAA